MKGDIAQTPAVGDWVYSDSPGIWRVYRVIHDLQRFRFSLQERPRTDRKRLVFSKRLVNEAWKPAFSNEVANAEIVQPVSGGDKQRLEEYVATNPETFREFEAFQPMPIDLRMNLPLHVPKSDVKEELQRLVLTVFVGIGDGLTNDAILQRLVKSELARYDATNTMSNGTLQFVCRDHELRNNEYVFREVQLLLA